jgi:hypothetical protein
VEQDSDQLLRSLGIELVDADLQPAVHAECIRIARTLGTSDLQTVGFWPADLDVAVPPLVIQLGLALVELYRGTVAYIDANVYFPAFPLGEQQGEGEDDAGDSIFETKWLRESLALVLPKWVGEVGAGVPQLKAIIEGTRERYGFMLVDLTGFDQIGDHLNAVDLLDGVVIVARAGHSRERDLLRIQNQLPEAKNLGVVLVG